MERKRMIIVGISMACGGTEQAFLSFLNTVDRGQWEITMALACPIGPLMDRLPSDLTLISPLPEGDLFLLSAKNAPSVLGRILLRRPDRLPSLLRSAIDALLHPRRRGQILTRLWVSLMNALCPPLPPPEGGQYDLALSFWGDRTMFYVCDKVPHRRHLTWLHFDFEHPPREEALYRRYFARCDRVISVTESGSRLLRTRFPTLSGRMITFENRISPSRIRLLAEQPMPIPLPPSSLPLILTVARICHQKGTDRIPHLLRRLRDRGVHVRWCIIGEGREEELARLRRRSKELGVGEQLLLLGRSDNPYPYFAACTLFVLPSRFEGKPITVEEAKILGCPIAVYDYLSSREQLEGGRLGVIVAEEDEEAMVGAIATLIGSEPLREQYRRATLSAVPALGGQGMAQTDRLLKGEI